MPTQKQLHQNIAILDYDLDDLRDMRNRYKNCRSAVLRSVIDSLSEAESILLNKRIQLQEQLDRMKRSQARTAYEEPDDFLQDYREVLA